MTLTSFLRCLLPTFDFFAARRHRQLVIDRAHEDALRIEGYGASWAECFPQANLSHQRERSRNLMAYSEWLRADQQSSRPRSIYTRGV